MAAQFRFSFICAAAAIRLDLLSIYYQHLTHRLSFILKIGTTVAKVHSEDKK